MDIHVTVKITWNSLVQMDEKYEDGCEDVDWISLA
jgi:hypothetical protein